MWIHKEDLIDMLDIGSEFLFISRHDGDECAEWQLSGNEYFFESHFLTKGVLPASLLLEAMLQSAVTSFYCKGLIKKSEKAIIYSTALRLYRGIEGSSQLLQFQISDVCLMRGLISATVRVHKDSVSIAKGDFKYKVDITAI